jgi:hypothetical protein
MPGPQGPEVNETITGDKASVVNKAEVPAIEIGEKEPPKTSLVDSGSTNSTVGADTASSNSSSSGTGAQTTTTSNQPQRKVGFRYYRDLGQN